MVTFLLLLLVRLLVQFFGIWGGNTDTTKIKTTNASSHDYFNFFLGLSLLECPHFLFLQLWALMGNLA